MGRTWPRFEILMTPRCSTMKSRRDPSPAFVNNTGATNPVIAVTSPTSTREKSVARALVPEASAPGSVSGAARAGQTKTRSTATAMSTIRRPWDILFIARTRAGAGRCRLSNPDNKVIGTPAPAIRPGHFII